MRWNELHHHNNHAVVVKSTSHPLQHNTPENSRMRMNEWKFFFLSISCAFLYCREKIMGTVFDGAVCAGSKVIIHICKTSNTHSLSQCNYTKENACKDRKTFKTSRSTNSASLFLVIVAQHQRSMFIWMKMMVIISGRKRESPPRKFCWVSERKL